MREWSVTSEGGLNSALGPGYLAGNARKLRGTVRSQEGENEWPSGKKKIPDSLQGDDMIARLHIRYTLANRLDDASSLVS